MHPIMSQLLDLHQVNVQRQRLLNDRSSRSDKRTQADQALAKFQARYDTAQQMVDDQAALIRQYRADVERCDATIADMREKQMEAKSNKEYLECINGVENAKAEKKLREESLSNLNASVEELQAKADAALQKLNQIKAKHEKFISELDEPAAAASSSEELERLYTEKRAQVDPAFLEVYERLIEAKHPSPLIPVDADTRATPLGQIISHNDCERLRGGQLVTDPMTNGILYIPEQAPAE